MCQPVVVQSTAGVVSCVMEMRAVYHGDVPYQPAHSLQNRCVLLPHVVGAGEQLLELVSLLLITLARVHLVQAVTSSFTC